MEQGASIGRRERNKLDKRRRISSAARTLFHAQGFAETTTAQIACLAGVAEGTVFRYVAHKEDLLVLAFVDELDEAVRAAFAAVDPGASFVDQILGYFSGIFAYHEADPAIARLFLREVGVLRDAQRDYRFGLIPMMTSLEAIVATGQAHGEVHPALNPPAVARLCFALYWGALRDWANGASDGHRFRAELAAHLDLAVRGLARSG